MDPGKMDRRVRLIRENEGTDSFGGIIKTLETVAEVWAEVRDLRGREFFAAQQINSEITTQFTLYHRMHINTDWIIRWKDRDYRIYQIIEIGRNEGLEIMAAASNNG